MRWARPINGDTRVREFFAWLPIRIDHESRWLETVVVKERYWTDWVDGLWLKVEFLPNSGKPEFNAFEDLR